MRYLHTHLHEPIFHQNTSACNHQSITYTSPRHNQQHINYLPLQSTSLIHLLVTSSHIVYHCNHIVDDISICRTILYADNNASINIIHDNKISSRSRHLDIPITFSYEQQKKKYYTTEHINIKLNAAHISTKTTSSPILAHRRNFFTRPQILSTIICAQRISDFETKGRKYHSHRELLDMCFLMNACNMLIQI